MTRDSKQQEGSTAGTDFGPVSSLDFNQTYVASTSGFVFGFVGSSAEEFVVATGVVNKQVVTRIAQVTHPTLSLVWSFDFPVAAGDRYEVQASGSFSASTRLFYRSADGSTSLPEPVERTQEEEAVFESETGLQRHTPEGAD